MSIKDLNTENKGNVSYDVIEKKNLKWHTAIALCLYTLTEYLSTLIIYTYRAWGFLFQGMGSGLGVKYYEIFFGTEPGVKFRSVRGGVNMHLIWPKIWKFVWLFWGVLGVG